MTRYEQSNPGLFARAGSRLALDQDAGAGTLAALAGLSQDDASRASDWTPRHIAGTLPFSRRRDTPFGRRGRRRLRRRGQWLRSRAEPAIRVGTETHSQGRRARYEVCFTQQGDELCRWQQESRRLLAGCCMQTRPEMSRQHKNRTPAPVVAPATSSRAGPLHARNRGGKGCKLDAAFQGILQQKAGWWMGTGRGETRRDEQSVPSGGCPRTALGTYGR